jgi:glutathione S-transferase
MAAKSGRSFIGVNIVINDRRLFNRAPSAIDRSTGETTAMKLYFTPNLCSLPVHVALREAGLPFDLERVDLRTKRTASGDDFLAIAPKGYVPALRLDGGELLTETAALLQYVADLAPAGRLSPPPGTFARVRHTEWLTFLSSELHKGFAPFTIMAGPSPESRAWAKERLERRVALIGQQLAGGPYLLGEGPYVVDFYAFWALNTYARLLQAELDGPLPAYLARLRERPAVRAALAAEGVA